jgi:hypothetical protein
VVDAVATHIEMKEASARQSQQFRDGLEAPQLAAARVLDAPPNATPRTLYNQFRAEEG